MKRVKWMLAVLMAVAMVCLGVACGSPGGGTDASAPDDGTLYTPGTYTGTGIGNGGEITVDVTVTEDAITDITIVSQQETPTVSEKAFEEIPAEIIEYQSLGVDARTGATLSSMGLINAVTDALKQAGADVSALQSVPTTEKSTAVYDKTADLVVIGGGASGMSAAIRAAQLGQSVILVEKTYRLGGCVSVSGGNQVVQGSALQAEAGVTDDSPELMVSDFLANAQNTNNVDLLTLFADNIGPATDWLNQDVGVQYDMDKGLHNLAEYTVNRELAYAGGGAQAAYTMTDALEAAGVEVLLDTTAEHLVTDDSGAVTGVTATAKDGSTYNLAAANVILATGGYGNSDVWLTDDLKNNALFYGPATATGDGLTMADELGAQINLELGAKCYPNGIEISTHRAKSTIDGNLVVWKMSAILVNPEGQRVVNEHASNHEILVAEQQQTDSMLYLLMDQENFTAWRNALSATGISDQMVDQYLENNGSTTPVFAHGDTLADLAAVAGMDAATLQQTVDDYNGYVESGTDPLGRSGEYLSMKIGDGPYYLVEQKPRYATTMGGIAVNTDLQVLDTSGNVIPGLYAVGEVVDGVMGSDSPSGANNAWAITSGMLAADIIAQADGATLEEAA